MATPYDVDANKLIEKISQELKKTKEIKAPEWASYVKTGHNRVKIPYNEDWWHTRAAAIFRRIYIEPMGTARLRKVYGGKKNRGYKPERFYPATGNIIRKILQQLEAAKFVKKVPKGRSITPKGQKFLNRIASDIFVAPKPTAAQKEPKKAKEEKPKATKVKEEPKTKEEPKKEHKAKRA